MQEFSSVTASSYDAEALAPLLTEKAAEGWAVISIVAAGTNIVAYLSRDSADADVPAAEIETEAAPTLPGDDAPVSDAAADADEPAGWGTAPDNDVADLAAQVGAEDTAGEGQRRYRRNQCRRGRCRRRRGRWSRWSRRRNGSAGRRR